jgi:iron complex outermembrane recepter protein
MNNQWMDATARLGRWLIGAGVVGMLTAARAAEPDGSGPDVDGWSIGRPQQVLDRQALAATSYTDLGRALSALVPAYRFAAPFAVNGDDHVHTGTLRGLAPDALVVLVNGKRHHSSSKLYTSAQAGRGSVGVDLALLPMAAVARVEIYSGGAGGRFGSGAQAGVINIVLDDVASGGRLDAAFGQRRTAIEGVPRFAGAIVDDAAGTIRLGLSGNLTEDDGSGDDVSLLGSWGWTLGDGGFMRLSAEYHERDVSNRAGYDPRPQYPLQPNGDFDVREQTVDRRRSIYGEPAMEELNILFNAGVPLSDRVDFYGFTFLGTRDAESYAPFVRPVDEVNVPALYPDGFLPRIESDMDDRSFTIGFRGEHWGWHWDASYNQRDDELDLSLANSLNPTFAAGSPRAFVTGNNETKLITMQLDVKRSWSVGWLDGPLTLEAGVASIEEEYEVETGDLAAAFDAGLGNPGAASLPASSVGFPGFPVEVEGTRETTSIYGTLHATVNDWLDLSASARVDDLDDLDTLYSADLGTRARLTDTLEARAAVGRGFRAPSLAQTTYLRPETSVTATGERLSGIFAIDSPAVAALGGGAVGEETATHASLGFSYRPLQNLELAVDLWQVRIDDRVVLSEVLDNAAVGSAVAAAGLDEIDSVQFVLNGLDTRTRGVDARAGYQLDLLNGRLDLEAAVSHHRTRASGLQSLTTVLGDDITPFGARAADQLEREQPETKLIAQAAWQRGPWRLRGTVTHLSEVIDYGASEAERLDMDAGLLLDLDLRYQVNRRLNLGVGVHNLLNEYPDARSTEAGAPVSHAIFPFSGYSGFNAGGRLMYARLSADFD